MPADARDKGVHIGGIELQRSDRQRRLEIGQRSPVRPHILSVVRAPDAAIHSSHEQDIRIGRMWQHGVNRAVHFIVRGHIFALSTGRGTWSQRNPSIVIDNKRFAFRVADETDGRVRQAHKEILIRLVNAVAQNGNTDRGGRGSGGKLQRAARRRVVGRSSRSGR